MHKEDQEIKAFFNDLFEDIESNAPTYNRATRKRSIARMYLLRVAAAAVVVAIGAGFWFSQTNVEQTEDFSWEPISSTSFLVEEQGFESISNWQSETDFLLTQNIELE
ncbi:MAG: hypothetical protein AAFO07_26940 [Bacteroidota bacterium]